MSLAWGPLISFNKIIKDAHYGHVFKYTCVHYKYVKDKKETLTNAENIVPEQHLTR